MMRRTAAIVAVWLALAAAPRVVAQVIPQDTLADTLAVDTVDHTARFIEAQVQAATRMPVLPRVSPAVPLPPGTRILVTRDSIEWLHGLTLGDVLAQVPGVYLWRGGWYGRTESVAYQGRGTSSTEYFLDGLPYLPLGIDSAGVDPALISLSFLERIEIERLPAQLRVYLFTKRYDRLAPRSRIGVTTGDADIARYEGTLERRFPSGIGFALGAEYFSSPTVASQSSSYSNNHLWLQGSYLPNEKFGVQYQLVRSGPKRRAFAVATLADDDTLSLGYEASRTDAQLRLSYHTRTDGLGPAVDVLYGRTGWSGGGVEQQVHQVGGALSIRHPLLAFTGSAFYRSRWTPLDARASTAWTPSGAFSGSAEAAYQVHDGSRISRWLLLRGGIAPLPNVAFTGAARIGQDVAAPAVDTARVQQLRDYEVTAGWQRPWIGLHLALSRISSFTPLAPAEYLQVPALGRVPGSEWVTVAVRLAPRRWLTLESWYSDPRDATGIVGVPPSHSMTRGTIRSKFLRTFPSGTFDLKLQLGLESWGTGVIGQDAGGTPITLPGATFLRSLVQFQIGTFSFFWDRGNLTASTLAYVPGFRLPQYGTTFGVRWEFVN